MDQSDVDCCGADVGKRARCFAVIFFFAGYAGVSRLAMRYWTQRLVVTAISAVSLESRLSPGRGKGTGGRGGEGRGGGRSNSRQQKETKRQTNKHKKKCKEAEHKAQKKRLMQSDNKFVSLSLCPFLFPTEQSSGSFLFLSLRVFLLCLEELSLFDYTHQSPCTKKPPLARNPALHYEIWSEIQRPFRHRYQYQAVLVFTPTVVYRTY